ncbi:MAG: hypothetical protein MHM6MM_002548 [Cercozoa sp. M6MM]
MSMQKRRNAVASQHLHTPSMFWLSAGVESPASSVGALCVAWPLSLLPPEVQSARSEVDSARLLLGPPEYSRRWVSRMGTE